MDDVIDPPATGEMIRFRMRALDRGLEAEVRLRETRGRWIAMTESRGREMTGIGSTPRAAIVASLAWLGSSAASELLVDLGLLDVSRRRPTLTPA